MARLLVEVAGGCVTRLLNMDTGRELAYILRDHDDIAAGDDDPVFQCPRCHRLCETHAEGCTDSPICDRCWHKLTNGGKDARGNYWLGYWAGRHATWGRDAGPASCAYNTGFDRGRAERDAKKHLIHSTTTPTRKEATP